MYLFIVGDVRAVCRSCLFGGSWDRTQAIRLGRKHLLLLRHLVNHLLPVFILLSFKFSLIVYCLQHMQVWVWSSAPTPCHFFSVFVSRGLSKLPQTAALEARNPELRCWPFKVLLPLKSPGTSFSCLCQLWPPWCVAPSMLSVAVICVCVLPSLHKDTSSTMNLWGPLKIVSTHLTKALFQIVTLTGNGGEDLDISFPWQPGSPRPQICVGGQIS